MLLFGSVVSLHCHCSSKIIFKILVVIVSTQILSGMFSMRNMNFLSNNLMSTFMGKNLCLCIKRGENR